MTIDPARELRETAREMFEEYCADAGGKTHDGKPIPTWDQIGDKVRGHWIAAARVGLRRSHERLVRVLADDGE
jgi:hypothetical protein